LLQSQTKLKEQIDKKKLVLYAPTFRDYNRKACGFSHESIEQLKNILNQHNAVLGIRAHPRDQGLFAPFIDHLTILDLDYQHYPELNIVMRNTDILITDYSSLWVDYLLLDRPIIGYAFDMEQYQDSRGLLFNYQNQFPGELCETNEDLKKLIATALNQEEPNKLSTKQHWVKDFFHAPLKTNRCEAIHELLKN
jgi:CDP-glycerol glycerophosphotransferase (TagB/SpsB family)